MKKRIFTILVPILLLSLLLSACGGGYSGYRGPSHSPQETASETPKSAFELLTEAVDRSMVPEEQLDPFSTLSNAILDHTYITLKAESDEGYTVDIRYPLVSDALTEKAALLPASPTEEEINTLLAELTLAVENESLPTAEGTYDLPIRSGDMGKRYIEWTHDAKIAMTGGLSGMLG